MEARSFAHKAKKLAIRSCNRALGLRPSSRPFVSGDGFRALAQHRLEGGKSRGFGRVEAGDIVFVETHELPRFREELLPGIQKPFVLVTHNSDWNVDGALAGLADDPRILGWFAQNCVARHKKLRPIPIGLENRWHHNNGVVGDYARLRRRMPDKKMRVLYAFSIGTNEGERRPAMEALRRLALADSPAWTDSDRYRTTLAGYGFVASPPGNGFDCHRTWEALYLGTVPIVRSSPFFESFPGLPVLPLEDWSVVGAWDGEFLKARFDESRQGMAECPYLWLDYWQGEIAAMSERGR